MIVRQGHVPAPTAAAHHFQDPRPHPLLEPEARVPCPACGLSVGCRRGQLNRHRVTAPTAPGARMPDGLRPSPLGPDGWCTGKAT